MKRITLDKVTYTLTVRSYDGLVAVKGPGLVGGIVLPQGVTLESADLRDHLRAGVAAYRERARTASEQIQERVRAGKV